MKIVEVGQQQCKQACVIWSTHCSADEDGGGRIVCCAYADNVDDGGKALSDLVDPPGLVKNHRRLKFGPRLKQAFSE